MVLVLAGPGERDVEFGVLSAQHAGGRVGTASVITSGEEVLAEVGVRLLARTDEGAQTIALGAQLLDLR